MASFKKIAATAVKILVSAVLLWLVFRKIPFREVGNVLQNSRAPYIGGAVVLFVLSQYISSIRLLNFFHAHTFLLSSKSNFQLYLVGMFYNFFIPGGIGGDAYKVYFLKKTFGWDAKKLTAALFADRLSGLAAIVLLSALLTYSFIDTSSYFGLLGLGGAVMITGFFAWQKIFPSFRKIYFLSILYSLTVQALQVFCIYFILKAIHFQGAPWIYFVVFLMSSVLSLISFSGIGVREWLFLKAAQYFKFDAAISVTAAMLFSAITAFISLSGVYFMLTGLKLKELHKVPI